MQLACFVGASVLATNANNCFESRSSLIVNAVSLVSVAAKYFPPCCLHVFHVAMYVPGFTLSSSDLPDGNPPGGSQLSPNALFPSFWMRSPHIMSDVALVNTSDALPESCFFVTPLGSVIVGLRYAQPE